MTTIDERFQAIQNARSFMYKLMNPKVTPKVPKKIREEARAMLKHFPGELCLNDIERRERLIRTLKTEMENIFP
jgi:hypothetical protein